MTDQNVVELTDKLLALLNQHPPKPGRLMQIKEVAYALHLAIHADNGNGHEPQDASPEGATIDRAAGNGHGATDIAASVAGTEGKDAGSEARQQPVSVPATGAG